MPRPRTSEKSNRFTITIQNVTTAQLHARQNDSHIVKASRNPPSQSTSGREAVWRHGRTMKMNDFIAAYDKPGEAAPEAAPWGALYRSLHNR